eukprot:snap_masked-scaffold_5-processed-gene-17.45-mRNA-1 protein AED:1.00 eAED:1.00 QI:0/-1/0/0/-1/1/1/0/59
MNLFLLGAIAQLTYPFNVLGKNVGNFYLLSLQKSSTSNKSIYSEIKEKENNGLKSFREW